VKRDWEIVLLFPLVDSMLIYEKVEAESYELLAESITSKFQPPYLRNEIRGSMLSE
jgi:hypothetical protein